MGTSVLLMVVVHLVPSFICVFLDLTTSGLNTLARDVKAQGELLWQYWWMLFFGLSSCLGLYLVYHHIPRITIMFTIRVFWTLLLWAEYTCKHLTHDDGGCGGGGVSAGYGGGSSPCVYSCVCKPSYPWTGWWRLRGNTEADANM